MNWKVQWSDFEFTNEKTISLSNEAISLVKNISQSDHIPTIVEFFNDCGVSFCIGVGRDKTILTYQKSNDPPYYISSGNKNVEGTEWFCYGQEESEYLASNLIDIELGYQALIEFISTGSMPAAIEWEKL
jgi:hypothetical protein